MTTKLDKREKEQWIIVMRKNAVAVPCLLKSCLGIHKTSYANS